MVFDCIKKFDKLDVEICEVYSSQSFEVKFLNYGGTQLKKIMAARHKLINNCLITES